MTVYRLSRLEGGAEVGHAEVKPLGGGTVQLRALGVSEPHRRRGIGSDLLARALAMHPESRWVVNVGDDNAGARRLYARFGFREVGEGWSLERDER